MQQFVKCLEASVNKSNYIIFIRIDNRSAMLPAIVELVLKGLGGLIVLKFIFTALKGIYARVLRPGKDLKKYGAWAVVTGATDGIGKAMAFELAKKGLNIVLISRTQEKLNECMAELNAKYSKIEVKTLSVDYSKFDEAARNKVSTFLSSLDVGVLVNNVGISYPYPKYLHELDETRIEQLMTLNVYSTTWMTKIVVDGMVARKRGAIVNIASAAGVVNSPLLSGYGAAKSYIAMFSRTLNVELAKFGVHVQCQVPLFVATKLAKIKKASLTVASPSGYAKSAIAAIGYESLVSPFWSHALQMWLLSALPESIVAYITMSMHEGIRKAGMKKDEKLAAENKVKSN